MPSSAVRSFTDPDDYAATIRGGIVELTVTGRGDFSEKLTRVDLPRLWLQRFSENLARIVHATNTPGRAMVQFRTALGPSLSLGGLEIGPTVILRHGEADTYHHRSSGSVSFAAMSLPIEEMAAVAEAMAGVDLTPPQDMMLITSSLDAIAKFRRLHAAAGDLAENAPEIIANPDAARGLEQALIEALVDCLDTRQRTENSLAQSQHAIVMRRFRRVVEENPEQPLSIAEICKAIGVSESTSRMCCQEHLGMSPKRYLLLRRMGLARRALRQAKPDATSVIAVGTRYGFWELGRFAGVYQSLFGESPSATLRRPPEQQRAPIC
jgi:AraC-like DNA-binding protein